MLGYRLVRVQKTQVKNEVDLRPHKMRYWMTSKDKQEDPVAFQESVEAICTTYHAAASLEADGVHVVSCDEKTGIQAVERAP